MLDYIFTCCDILSALQVDCKLLTRKELYVYMNICFDNSPLLHLTAFCYMEVFP